MCWFHVVESGRPKNIKALALAKEEADVREIENVAQQQRLYAD